MSGILVLSDVVEDNVASHEDFDAAELRLKCQVAELKASSECKSFVHSKDCVIETQLSSKVNDLAWVKLSLNGGDIGIEGGSNGRSTGNSCRVMQRSMRGCAEQPLSIDSSTGAEENG
ncbi:hypothetical protein CsSME_00045354 [Camellia sinensis var. sinensis]